jgi:DNA/RNA-binding domain of Phe-tRNA-synthetase-like protein
MSLTVAVASHPALEVGAFVTRFAHPLAEIATPDAISAFFEPHAQAPLVSTDTVRAEVRQLLRAAGFKPSGRSKPASEYLHAAALEGRFPRINAAVDACNAVSLCSGLPISVVDVDKLDGVLAIEVAAAGTSYVFNPSGQVIDASHLLALCDASGVSGTPVKDAQRTKTGETTRAALSVVWGTRALPGRTQKATAWYRELVSMIAGATVEDVAITSRTA